MKVFMVSVKRKKKQIKNENRSKKHEQNIGCLQRKDFGQEAEQNKRQTGLVASKMIKLILFKLHLLAAYLASSFRVFT